MGCTQLVSAIIFRTVNFARMEHALLRMKCGALEAAAQKIGALAAELTNSKVLLCHPLLLQSGTPLLISVIMEG